MSVFFPVQKPVFRLSVFWTRFPDVEPVYTGPAEPVSTPSSYYDYLSAVSTSLKMYWDFIKKQVLLKKLTSADAHVVLCPRRMFT